MESAVMERAPTAIFESIRDIRAKKKGSESSTVILEACLNGNDIKTVFDSLVESGAIQNQPTRDGKESYFIINNIDLDSCESFSSDVLTADILNSSLSVNNQPPSANKTEFGDQHQDSFLCFLDKVETPTKELTHHLPSNLSIFRGSDKQDMKYATIENIYEQDTEQNDILEFKKHIWDVVKNLEAEVQQLKNSFSERKGPPQDQHNGHILYERLICCLEERVKTLEKELNSKQKIIETILKQQDTRCHTQQVESIHHLKTRQSNSIEVQVQSTQEKTKNQAESKKAKVNKNPPKAESPKTMERNN